MTYLEFHLVFILPPIGVLLVLQPKLWEPAERFRLVWVFVVSAIAFVYTTPWDNYLVWRGVWSYGSERVLATLGFVPIEEYLFFFLQPIMTGLWTLWLLSRVAPRAGPRNATKVRTIGGILYTAVGLLGVSLLRFDSTVYAGLILSWSGLALAGQWFVAGHELWRRIRLVTLAVCAPTAFLWIVDWVAIRDGIWSLSSVFTVGLHFWGLPIEEALFFFVTNLLVVQGLLLFLPSRAFHPLTSNAKPSRKSVTHAIQG